MGRREHIRVRVISRALCVEANCRFCLTTYFDGVAHESECSRADCDNHLREAEELPPTSTGSSAFARPTHAPLQLPEPDSTQPELPYAPE